MNTALFDVAVSLVSRHGWTALNIDRIADAAGVSRATVWRHGITRASVEQEMRHRLAADYRSSLWPVPTQSGTGAQRLAAGLNALCDLCDQHLAFLANHDGERARILADLAQQRGRSLVDETLRQ